jgi:hypothetical protein
MKKVYQYSTDNNFIKEYQSISQASKQKNFKRDGILSCCKGKRKTFKKSIWSYGI